MNDIEKRYLKLLKHTLTDFHRVQKGEYQPIIEKYDLETLDLPKPIAELMKDYLKFTKMKDYALCRKATSNVQLREQGLDFPTYAETMVGLKRLENIEHCLNEIIRNKIPGDVIETGVWRGGASIYAKAVLKVNGIEDKKVWVADSFQGLPEPDGEKYPEDKEDTLFQLEVLRVEEEEVRQNFEKYDLLDDKVIFLKGWFKDTLPTLKNEKFSLIRLDGDMYESTMNGLENLYPLLAKGGYLIIDDFALQNCKQAVLDYRAKHNIEAEMIKIDWTGVYWKKNI